MSTYILEKHKFLFLPLFCNTYVMPTIRKNIRFVLKPNSSLQSVYTLRNNVYITNNLYHTLNIQHSFLLFPSFLFNVKFLYLSITLTWSNLKNVHKYLIFPDYYSKRQIKPEVFLRNKIKPLEFQPRYVFPKGYQLWENEMLFVKDAAMPVILLDVSHALQTSV